MIKRLAFLTSLLLATPCAAQPVQQSGNVTPSHAACWTTNGVAQDCGNAAIPFLSSLGIVGQGQTFCMLSAPPTTAYNSLCFSISTTGDAQMVLQNFGGATAQNFDFVLNGTTYNFPLALSGILGPVTSIISNTACWNNTQGTLLKDCGWTLTTPAGANAIPYWSSTTALSSIAAVNNAVVSTNGSGVPAESTTLPSALTIPSPTVSGTVAGNITLSGNNTYSGTAAISNATASTTPTTGAITVTGGAGIAGDLFVGGTAAGVQVSNTQNATSQIKVTNSSTGASAKAQLGLATGTANSSWTQTLTDNGAPTVAQDTGSAVTSIAEKMNGTAILTKTKAGGVQIGAPTGADKGAGAINAQTVYANGAQFLPTVPTTQTFTSSSGTYTTPAGVTWIRVKMVGGGGGGGGVGGTTGPTGTTGGNSTFGTTLLVANGGVGGIGGTSNVAQAGGAGGTASLGSGPLGWAMTGNAGGAGFSANTTSSERIGGSGGASCLGGAPKSPVSTATTVGTAAATNSGSGGSGSISTTIAMAGGGGAGGCLDAIITSPSATYAYAVGGTGAGGIGTGTNAQTGGAGAAGQIVVEEHYNY